MKTRKQITAWTLLLVMLLSLCPTATAAGEQPGSLTVVSAATGLDHRISVIVRDGEVYANAVDYCTALGKDFIQNVHGWWLLPGAGDRQLGYHFGHETWRAQCNLGRYNYEYGYLEGISPMVEVGEDLYFPLISAANRLGVTILQNGAQILLYVPGHTQYDVINLAKEAMDSNSPLNVTSWEEPTDGFFTKASNELLAFFDVTFRIISSGDYLSALSVDDDALEEALLSSMSGGPSYDANSISDKWEDFDFIMSHLGGDTFWDGPNRNFSDFYLPFMGEARDFLTGRAISGTMTLTDIAAEYIVKTARLMEISTENLAHAENVFCNEEYSLYNKLNATVKKTADEYRNGIDQMEFLVEEGAKAGFENLIDLNEALINPTLLYAEMGTALALNLFEQIYDYEYGMTSTLKAHIALQELIRQNFENCCASGDLTAGSLGYMLDCAMFYAQAKVSSVSALGGKIDLNGNGRTAAIYRELASINMADVMLSFPENAAKATNATDESLMEQANLAEEPEVPEVPEVPGTAAAGTPQVTDMHYGAILLELEKLGEIESLYFNDADADGSTELLVKLITQDDPRGLYFIADGDHSFCQIQKAVGASESLGFYLDTATGRLMLAQSSGNASASRYFYYWDGWDWTTHAEWHRQSGVFHSAIIEGESVSEDAWNRYTETLTYQISDLAVTELDVLSRFIPGDTEWLMYQSEKVSEAHPRFISAHDGNLDGDLSTDFIYFFQGQAAPIFGQNRNPDADLPLNHDVLTAVIFFLRPGGMQMETICIEPPSPDAHFGFVEVDENVIIVDYQNQTIRYIYREADSAGRPAFERLIG